MYLLKRHGVDFIKIERSLVFFMQRFINQNNTAIIASVRNIFIKGLFE